MKARSLFVMLVLTILFSVVATVFSEDEKSQGEFRAVLVGIDSYKKWEDGNNFADLSCCVNDITVFAEVLKKNGYKPENIQIVKERVFDDGTVYSVNRQEIENRVKDVLFKSKSEDVVLVYFACHGVRIENVNYLVPFDGHYIPDKNDVHFNPITSEEYANRLALLLPVETVYMWMSNCPAKTKFILTDACQNNVVANVKKGLPEVRSTFKMDASKIPAGLIQITSCSPGETAKENPEAKLSAFMLAILAGLKDEADKDNDGRTSIAELFDYVSKRVPEEAQKVPARGNDKKQTPQMNLEDVGGDIVFSVNIPKVKSNELKAAAAKKIEASRKESKEENREKLLTEASTLLDEAEREYPGGEYTYLRVQIKEGLKGLKGRKAEELAAQAYEDYEKGEYQSGLTKIESALKLQPDNFQYKQFRLTIKEKLKRVEPGPQEEANELLKEAYKLFEAGNRTEALTKVESALELDPGNVGALLLKRSLKESPSPSVSTMASTSNREALPVPDRRTSPEPGSTTSTSKLGEGQTAGEKKTLNIKGIDYTFCWCPAGGFTMGSPETEEGRNEEAETPHEVTLSRGFWLLESEVTQAMWESVMETTIQEQTNKKEKYRDLVGVGPDYPMYNVSWDECKKFCEELSKLSGESMRLPSEAEWEYACRAGTRTAIYTGDLKILGQNNAPALDAISWYGGNSSVGYTGEGCDSSEWEEKQYSGSPSGVHPVGQKEANAWGLRDMIGNVWEWCQDWYDKEYYKESPTTDPTGPESGSDRVYRGGSWYSYAGDCRSAYRIRIDPGFRFYNLGFRLALSSASPNR